MRINQNFCLLEQDTHNIKKKIKTDTCAEIF